MASLIKNMEKLSRVISYDGLCKGKNSPTDIDAVFEINNHVLLMFEVKEHGKDITQGQKFTTTRIIDAWNSVPGHIGVVVYATHPAENQVITLADCIVQKIYRDKGWYGIYDVEMNVGQFVEMFAKKYNVEELKGLK